MVNNREIPVIPHLWFNRDAVEAVEFYCQLFPKSTIISRDVIADTSGGDCDYLSFELWGLRFEGIGTGSAGGAESLCPFNPSISFMVNFDPLFFRDSGDPKEAARRTLGDIWEKLSDGGQPLMELGEYDFSPQFGWIQDKYGLSWQLILTDPDGEPRPSIMPSMLFVNEVCGKAEEAGDFYRSIFPGSKKGLTVRYPAGQEPEKEGSVMFADFRLGKTWITAEDSALNHDFRFNEAVSFIIYCKNQDESEYYWKKLSTLPEATQSGWLKDKYGVSWQIIREDQSRSAAASKILGLRRSLIH